MSKSLVVSVSSGVLSFGATRGRKRDDDKIVRHQRQLRSYRDLTTERLDG